MPKSWKDRFSKQEVREIEFCVTYKDGFGAQSHHMRIIIAKMADLLDMAEMVICAEEARAKTLPTTYYEERRHATELLHKLDGLETQPIKENAFKSIRSVPIVVNHETPEPMDGLEKITKEDFERVLKWSIGKRC